MIKLKILYEEIVKEYGDLDNIESYPLKANYEFKISEDIKVKVLFEKWNESDIKKLKLGPYENKNIYNILYKVNNEESQFVKTDYKIFIKILKTVVNVIYDFLDNNKEADGLTLFAANKDPQLFNIKTDKQKSNFYKVIMINQLKKLSGWNFKEFSISENDDFEGIFIYKKENIKSYDTNKS